MSNDGYFGHAGIPDSMSGENSHAFQIRQHQGQVRTATPVKIVKVHGGGLGAPPTVDVQLLVKQIDGQGNATAHGIVYGIPVTRNQGGSSAIINDPEVGDVGHIVISDRDISSVKATADQANPGSFRMHDVSDGVYHGAMLNKAAPKQYLMKNSDGWVLANSAGSQVILRGGDVIVIPGSGTVYLGGDPNKGGTFSPVMTEAGPSSTVKAKI